MIFFHADTKKKLIYQLQFNPFTIPNKIMIHSVWRWKKNIPILPSSYNEAHFKLYYGSLHTNEKILLIPPNFPPPAIFFCFDFFHPPFVIVSHHLLFSFTNLEYNHPQPKSPPKPAQNYRHYTTEQDQAPFETGAPKPNRTR